MSTLKVGDRVRLVGRSWGTDYDELEVGDVITIDDIDNVGSIWAGSAGTVGKLGKLYSSENPEESGDFRVELVESFPREATMDDLNRESDQAEVNVVDHPAHYNSDPSGVECITIIRHRNFNVGNSIKYLWRAGLKDDAKHIEDLRKAAWYIQDEINRLESLGEL